MKNCNVSEILGGANSARKMAAPIPRGTAINNAMLEVTKVPYINGRAPNWSASGSQTSLMKNRSPNLWRGSAGFVHNSQTTITVIRTTLAAKIMVIRRASSSPEARRARKERESEDGPAPFRVVLVVATVSVLYY